MKRLKCILLSMVMITTVTGHSQARNKESMVKNIFAVLANKDVDGFVKLFPDATTLQTFISKILENDTILKRRDTINSALSKITDSVIQAQLHKDFIKDIKKGEDKGVDWTQASFKSYKADSVFESNEGITVSKLAGSIYFNVGNKEYFLEFSNVIWFENRGWYCVDIGRIDEKINEINGLKKDSPVYRY